MYPLNISIFWILKIQWKLNLIDNTSLIRKEFRKNVFNKAKKKKYIIELTIKQKDLDITLHVWKGCNKKKQRDLIRTYMGPQKRYCTEYNTDKVWCKNQYSTFPAKMCFQIWEQNKGFLNSRKIVLEKYTTDLSCSRMM